MGGTRRGTVLPVSAKITVPDTALARSTTTANASRVWMERTSGLDLIALNEHALATLPGSEMWSMPTMFTLGSSAQTRALTEEPAGLRSIWQARAEEHTRRLGML